jgi:hypothetical protein
MKKQIVAGCVACVVACSFQSIPASAAEASSWIVESFEHVEEMPCLEEQTYPEAGKFVVSLTENAHVKITISQFSQEKESYLFYDVDLKEGNTTYVMPLEAGDYQIEMNYPSVAEDGEVIASSVESITIDNPDFDLSLQETVYHYTIWASEDAEYEYQELEEKETTIDGVHSCHTAVLQKLMSVFRGDVDQDGAVDLSDASMILSIYAQKAAGLDTESYTASQIDSADVDHNGTIELADATAVLTYYARKAAGFDPTWSEILN